MNTGHRTVAGLLAVIAVLLGLNLIVGRSSDVIRARAFVVVSEDGKVLAAMGETGGRGVVHVNDANENVLVSICSERGEGVVGTLNRDGQVLVDIGTTDLGDGMVSILNREGQRLVVLGTTMDSEGTVSTLNGSGQELVLLSVLEDGTAGVVLVFDPSSPMRLGKLQPK